MNSSFQFPAMAPAPARPKQSEDSGSNSGPARESSVLRASVLDVAMQLGIVGGDVDWMFNNPIGEEDESSSPGMTSASTATSDDLSAGTPPENFGQQSPPSPPLHLEIASAPALVTAAAVAPFQFMGGGKADRAVEFASLPAHKPSPKTNKLRKARKDGNGYESDAGYISESTKKDNKSKKKTTVVDSVDSGGESTARKNSQGTMASVRTRKESEKQSMRSRKESEKSTTKAAEKAEKKAAKARKKLGEKSGYTTGYETGYETDVVEPSRLPPLPGPQSLADSLVLKPPPMNFLGTGTDFLSSPPTSKVYATDYETDGDGPHASGSMKPKRSKFRRKKKEDPSATTDYETDGDEAKGGSKGTKKTRSFFRLGKSKDEYAEVVPPVPPMPIPKPFSPPPLPIAQLFASSRNNTPMPAPSSSSHKHARSPLPESFGASSSASVSSFSPDETSVTYLPTLISESPATPLTSRTFSPLPGTESRGSPAYQSQEQSSTDQLLISTSAVLTRKDDGSPSPISRTQWKDVTPVREGASSPFAGVRRPSNVAPRSTGLTRSPASYENQTFQHGQPERSVGRHGSSELSYDYGSSQGHGSSGDSHEGQMQMSDDRSLASTHISYSAESMGYSIHQDPYYPTVDYAVDPMPEHAAENARRMSDRESQSTSETRSSGGHTSSNTSVSVGNTSSATSVSDGSARKGRPKGLTHVASFASLSSGSSHGMEGFGVIPPLTMPVSPSRPGPFMKRTPSSTTMAPGSFSSPTTPASSGPVSRRPSLLPIVPSDEWIVPSPSRNHLVQYDIPPPSPPPIGPLPPRPPFNQPPPSPLLSRDILRAISPTPSHLHHASEKMSYAPSHPSGHATHSSHVPASFSRALPPPNAAPPPHSAPVPPSQGIRGRESPFPSRPMVNRPPSALVSAGAGASTFEARTKGRYRDLYGLQMSGPAGGDGPNDPSPMDIQRRKPWSADPLGPPPRGLPGISIEHASDDESEYDAVLKGMSPVLSRFGDARNPDSKRIVFDEEPKDLEDMSVEYNESGERFTDSRYQDEFDEGCSLYSDDGRQSQFLPDFSDDDEEDIGNRESKYSRYSAASHTTILDAQMSQEARLRFLQRVETLSGRAGGSNDVVDAQRRKAVDQTSQRDLQREHARGVGMQRGDIPPVPRRWPPTAGGIF